MRTDTVFKLAFNKTLDRVAEDASCLSSENSLARSLDVSRTTSRKVLKELLRRQMIEKAEAGWTLARLPEATDRYPKVETVSRGIYVERQFLEWMLRADTRPGALIREAELSRQFEVAPGAIREFLIRFSRFGMVEKMPNSGWLFHGFTEEFALELFEVRVMFERRSIELFVSLPDAAPQWRGLQSLRKEHEELLRNVDERFHDFSDLDDRFHRLIASVRANRFISDFHSLIALIFHYHYQWNKLSERIRNKTALVEHLDLIDALESRNLERAERSCLAHLNSARSTLLSSFAAAS